MRRVPSLQLLLWLAAIVVTQGLVTPSAALAQKGRGAPPGSGRSLWDKRVLFGRIQRADKLVQLADQALRKQRFGQAKTLLAKAILLRPYAASLWFGLGSIYSMTGQYHKCVTTIRKARRLEPKFRPSLVAFRLAFCLSLTRRITEGLVEYRKVVSGQWVTQTVLHWNMGDNYMALGRLTEAIRHYRHALRYNPGEKVLYFALAVALDRDGRHRAAERQIRRALQLDPNAESLDSKSVIWLPSHDHYYYRALRWAVLGRRVKALKAWQTFAARAHGKGPWRYVIRRRLEQLRTTPLDVKNIKPWGVGALDKGLLVHTISKALPTLRQCLGAQGTPQTAAAYRGLRLKLKASHKGLQSLSLDQRLGALPTNATSCLQSTLRKLPWRKLVTNKGDVRFAFDIVGP